MSTEMTRRIFLKRSLAAGAVSVAAGAGLLAPQQVLAAWPKAAFEAKDVSSALNALLGSDAAEDSDKISLNSPEVAEQAAKVSVEVVADMDNVSSITIVAPSNPVPLTANFKMGDNTMGYVKTFIKLAAKKDSDKTDIVAIVKSGDKLYQATKGVKVTIGGCGG